MVLTLFIIISLSFFAIRLIPGDVAGENAVPEIKAAMEARYHLDKSLGEQYFIFIKNFLSFDFGESMTLYPRRPVFTIIKDKLPLTVMLNIFSLLLTIPVGLIFGITAALKKNTWIDYAISTLTMVVISVPSFVYAFLIQYIFCFKLQWFPFLMAGGTNYFTWKMFLSLIPPVMALSFGTIAGFARTTRAELTEVLTSEFMLLARTKGLTRTQATVRHALRNCFVVIVPAVFGQFIGILGGSLIIEGIFSIPGVGGLTLNAIKGLDYNIFMLSTCFYTAIGLAASLVVDVSYGFIDPRIRMGSKK